MSSNPHAPPGLVSPWIERSKLLDWIGRHPEAKHQKVNNIHSFASYANNKILQAQEIAAGLEYLHSHDVVHGDLKVVSIEFDHFLGPSHLCFRITS